MLTKKEVQKRVLQNGKQLALNKFEWNKKTKTFSSLENNLVLDFSEFDNCTFKSGYNCTFNIESNCTFDTGSYCTFKTGYNCTFNTGSYCTFKTGYNCTFNTGSYCAFNTGADCAFNTGSYCTFNTGSYCTFNTGSGCTFNTGYYCAFNTGFYCVALRRDTSEIIILEEGNKTQLCPNGIKGFLINGNFNGEPHIIADGILSKIVNKKGDVYKVINYNETKQSYLIKKEVSGKAYYSHGKTLKEAKDSIIFKISDRDLTKWKHLKSSDKVTFEEAIQLYRDVTGACSEGTKYFVDQNKDKKKKSYLIKELIELTKEQYGSEIFIKYFEGK